LPAYILLPDHPDGLLKWRNSKFYLNFCAFIWSSESYSKKLFVSPFVWIFTDKTWSWSTVIMDDEVLPRLPYLLNRSQLEIATDIVIHMKVHCSQVFVQFEMWRRINFFLETFVQHTNHSNSSTGMWFIMRWVFL